MNKRISKNKISVIIPMRNSETTILKTLNSLFKQNHRIHEIIIVDNVSKDSSIETVNNFVKKNKRIPIKLLRNRKNIGVGGSYNKGIENSKGDLIILMHSDSELIGNSEIDKLIKPLWKRDVVATFSHIILPLNVWNTYNFWQKALFVRAVDKELPGLNTKFDCIRKNALEKIRGFDSKNYGHHIGIGAEDAALHIALKKIGRVVKTKAKVLHLHYLGGNYSLNDWVENRKLLARSYGRLIRLEWKELGKEALAFSIKPIIAGIGLFPLFFPYNLFLLFVFAIWYMNRMYCSKAIFDPKIMILPFITIYLIYYETFWMMEGLAKLEK